ncbi:chromate resistance protein ChrB domain-containing protein [Ideonella dechloratans]|uniref:chromate resistance protein ChrB domain-containing protein n=1 Tax=Ideonella dechloratans TaxID=36863 RepID=UPI0035B1F1BC
MTSWLILTATLPTSPSALRVKVWRALKATHCATLREGVYILPAQAATAAAFPALEATIRDAGASAHLLQAPARDAAQETTFLALFDRSQAYADFLQTLKAARKALGARGGGADEVAGRKTLRQLAQQLQALQAADFFPGAAAKQAEAALQALRTELERRWSPGEPAPAEAPLARLSVADFQGRTWATRARPWVDRLATAWLITRHVDRQPRFVWLRSPLRTPRGALGFDYDGARFTHVGERVSFEVVAESFGLMDRPGLAALAALVHGLDVGGLVQDEAAGIELLLRGLQATHPDDDALLQAALPIFDALLAGLAAASVSGSRP